MTATGIHDHPTLKLGKRDPVEKPAISFAAHLRKVPSTPIVDVPPKLTWPMDGNDRVGDCVVAALDHALEAIYTSLAGRWDNWTESQIFDYYKSQNPGFDPGSAQHGAGSSDDGGMIVQDFLALLVKQGVILGFAKVDHTDPAAMDAAIYLGLAIVTGELLTVAQQTQQVWDFVLGDGTWGGHATTSVGYPDASRDTCVTWGQLKDMTENFVAHSIDEAWFIVTQAHVDNPSFRAGYDLDSLGREFTALTGRPFVWVPSPAPPTPPPSPSADDQLAAVARPWVATRHIGRNHVMALALRAWLAEKYDV